MVCHLPFVLGAVRRAGLPAVVLLDTAAAVPWTSGWPGARCFERETHPMGRLSTDNETAD